MKHRIKNSGYSTGLLLLLLVVSFTCRIGYAGTLVCSANSNISNSNIIFNFNKLPHLIPAMVPVGTTIYDETMELDLWCAKEFNTANITSGRQKIYINRHNADNAFGHNSGLSFYVTINGERDTLSKSYDSGYSTAVIHTSSGGPVTAYYTKLHVSVRVELVKTAEKIKTDAMNNDVTLFSVGDAGTGSVHYRATGVKKIQPSDYTCNAITPNIYQSLPEIHVAELPARGRVETHVTDFSISLQCNGDLWSTLAINMAFNGTPVAGLEPNGVYQFLNRSGETAEGIGFQILHQDSTGAFIETGNNAWFKIGDFLARNKVVNVPLRAAYYRVKENVTPGELTGTITYTVNYM